jgi:dephospho-CoA kinase
MLKIGLTGGIGSGKSTVCTLFMTLGIPVFFSDEVAKTILNNNLQVKDELQELFGASIYDSYGMLNRKMLGAIVFAKPEALSKLNHIVHPLVRTAFLNWVEIQKSPYIIKEAAILIESGAYRDVDAIVSVYAPEPTRIRRVMAREGVALEAVEARIKRQMPEKEKLKHSDYILYNDGVQLLLPQVLKLHSSFLHL